MNKKEEIDNDDNNKVVNLLDEKDNRLKRNKISENFDNSKEYGNFSENFPESFSEKKYEKINLKKNKTKGK